MAFTAARRLDDGRLLALTTRGPRYQMNRLCVTGLD